MEGTKQVKVDNWGVFFLQRLKHFFNRTDYCDLTLQFQDYAQLKVHRLVLNACTEYFELLERTCEMYEDCLIMPDDLQADVVVPIVNFMYTGQLEYDCSLFDRLYSTAAIMNMTVLTKLLDAQKTTAQQQQHVMMMPQRKEVILNESLAQNSGRSLGEISANKLPPKKFISNRKYGPGPGIKENPIKSRLDKAKQNSPRPTRYEVPEELEDEDIFESSFADISYESRPLLKANSKQKSKNKKSLYDEASSSKKFEELKRSMNYNRRPPQSSSSSEHVESKTIDLEQINEFAYQQKLRAEYSKPEDNSDDDENNEGFDSFHEFDRSSVHSNEGEESKISLEGGSSMTVQTKPNMDHAKIISEVLKKYPHLVKSNKNIKLKIMSTAKKTKIEKKEKFVKSTNSDDEEPTKPSYTFVSKNADAMEKLVSLGVANINGPWLCFICGVPGIALNFPTYNKYYRHLVDVHKEKVGANICEHCGYKTGKRNHLLHHLYTKHDVPPPPTHHFPKCNQCSYVALTEAFLIKHKLGHSDNKMYSCNVCGMSFKTRGTLLSHIQLTGHKISPDRKVSNQCMYCNKIFLREANLYTHLKLAHKEVARKDGIIDNSDEEDESYQYEERYPSNYEYNNSNSPQQEHVQIKEECDGNIRIISNSNYNQVPSHSNRNPVKVLNSNYSAKKNYSGPPRKIPRLDQNVQQRQNIESYTNVIHHVEDMSNDLDITNRIVVLNDNEYILQTDGGQIGIDDSAQEILLSEIQEEVIAHSIASASQIDGSSLHKNSISTIVSTENHPIEIVVSNDQQYEAIVSSAPLIYTTTVADHKNTDDSSSHSREPQNDISMDNSEVVVIQDSGYAISENATENNGDIIVYSECDKLDDPTARNIESELAQIHGEAQPIEVIEEQHIVHETIETWQEQTVNESVDQAMETSDTAELAEDIQENTSIIEEVSKDPSASFVSENVNNEIHEMVTEGNEVVINDNGSIPEESVNTLEEIATENENSQETQEIVKGDEEQEVEEMEVEYQENNVEANLPSTPKEISKITMEWSDDDNGSKDTPKDEPVKSVENGLPQAEENVNNNTEEEEEETSISEEIVAEDVAPEVDEIVDNNTQSPVAAVENDVENNEEFIETEYVENVPQNEDDKKEDKEKVTENISNLLEDWDDNDSQSSQIKIVTEDTNAEENTKKVATQPAPKDPHIEKLVSDWDDDEDK